MKKNNIQTGKQKQKNFYDVRFSAVERGLKKIQCSPILFYDMRLISIMLGNLNADSIYSTLEIGCGQGTDAILFSKYSGNIIATDISIGALKVAKALSKMNNCVEKISVIGADAQNLPLRESVFNFVFCKDALHHVTNSICALSEMKRVTKIGGKIAAIEANPYNPQMILIGILYYSVDKGIFKNTKKNLIWFFRKVGLSNIDVQYAEVLPRHILFEYRSPLCSPIFSKSKRLLSILMKLENKLHSYSLLNKVSNYVIIHGIKKH